MMPEVQHRESEVIKIYHITSSFIFFLKLKDLTLIRVTPMTSELPGIGGWLLECLDGVPPRAALLRGWKDRSTKKVITELCLFLGGLSTEAGAWRLCTSQANSSPHSECLSPSQPSSPQQLAQLGHWALTSLLPRADPGVRNRRGCDLFSVLSC